MAYRIVVAKFGFTLPELLVSIVIIAMLIGSSVTFYGGYRIRADLSEANSHLLHAQVLARKYFTSAHTYIGFCATYPEFSSVMTSKLRFTCSEDRNCFRVRIIGSGSFSLLKSLVSETGVRTISVPTGWTMPTNASKCLIATKKGDCVS
ncbi:MULTISPECIES: type IV pilin protein [Candidatus Ichthyocystis]|uniref:Putative secretory protein n=1 Tax=Candidatus Ichthyocystis hellenicum TaxID=1561003 RepID=A0A0S4M151_9BURK|nr:MULTISPECIES: prepilin-type N-terminal cleavage/methylation domain-containing protein [Ichthyocystis]CUT17497.1 putative secretory protein [Candidatus Ichthyocystis hellenicum]